MLRSGLYLGGRNKRCGHFFRLRSVGKEPVYCVRQTRELIGARFEARPIHVGVNGIVTIGRSDEIVDGPFRGDHFLFNFRGRLAIFAFLLNLFLDFDFGLKGLASQITHLGLAGFFIFTTFAVTSRPL